MMFLFTQWTSNTSASVFASQTNNCENEGSVPFQKKGGFYQEWHKQAVVRFPRIEERHPAGCDI